MSGGVSIPHHATTPDATTSPAGAINPCATHVSRRRWTADMRARRNARSRVAGATSGRNVDMTSPADYRTPLGVPLSSAGFARAILVLGEASEGASTAPSEYVRGTKPPSELNRVLRLGVEEVQPVGVDREADGI